MFTTTLTIPADVLQAGGGALQAAVYGQLLAPYTPTSGPSSGTPLAVDQWVYFTGQDYAAAADAVPPFATYTAPGAYPLALPDAAIRSAHILFGIGSLPPIPVDTNGQPQQPSPLSTPGTYDFVELTRTTDGVLYLNTTMIDQFGFPIQIQVEPADAALPSGAGVTLSRTEVLGRFARYAAAQNAAYLQCSTDPFGVPLSTRILAPADAVAANAPQGVSAGAFSGPTSTLPQGTYYYAVTALNGTGAGAVESFAQTSVVRATVAPGQAVQVSWGPNSEQPAGTQQYNVYRGTPAGGSVTWGLLGSVAAASFAAGGWLTDTGQPSTPSFPPMNPLATTFDEQIQAFFGRFQGTATPLALTATDGTSDGYVYAFQGTTTTDPASNRCLQLTLATVTRAGAPVAEPPIATGTPFNVYLPYWDSNTYDAGNPPPPAWTPYPQVPASVMVLAAEGVFADNAQQVQSNLPPGVEPAAAPLYGTLLGSLENQIVAALTRGIANGAIAPANWGNGTAPVQLAPTLVAGQSSLSPGTPCAYVVTAMNGNGETVGSLEFSATPTTEAPCVQVNWLPMSPAEAESFGIYRSVPARPVYALVANVQNTDSVGAYVDDGAAGTPQNPPAYFPAGSVFDVYDAFFHQPDVSLNGAAYASPYDDQGGQSSILAAADPSSATITLGPWGNGGTVRLPG